MTEFRNLDSIYFRIERNGKWQNVCFSDLKEEEMKEAIDSWDAESLKRLAIQLGKYLRLIGDELDVVADIGDYDN